MNNNIFTHTNQLKLFAAEKMSYIKNNCVRQGKLGFLSSGICVPRLSAEVML
jgi:hypothetical protein